MDNLTSTTTIPSTATKDRPTFPVEEKAIQYRVLNAYPLDVEGAADAFRYLYGHGPDYGLLRPFPSFSYDPSAGVWREWEYSKGWTPRHSVLDAMTEIMASLCALEAWRLDDYEAQEGTETQYRKLRQRHLGGNVTRALKLAEVYMSVDGWDSNANLLGLPDGEVVYIAPTNNRYSVHVIDQEATDYVTKSMAATPTTPTTLWFNFLSDLTNGSEDMEDALQVWAGASMLPGNLERKVHVLFGNGTTGKTTFLQAVKVAMGDYAASARASVFTSEKNSHPAELLPFVNNHLVVLPELPNGAFRSDLIKVVSGGDAIGVRGMRQDPRTEQPKATMWFSANELPTMRMVERCNQKPSFDMAMRHQTRQGGPELAHQAIVTATSWRYRWVDVGGG